MNFVERMLDSQRAVMLDNEELEKELELCLRKYEETYVESNRALSRKNEQGLDVVHGSRMVVDIYTTYWSNRIYAVWSILNRVCSYEEQNKIQNRYPNFNFCMREFKEEYRKTLIGH